MNKKSIEQEAEELYPIPKPDFFKEGNVLDRAIAVIQQETWIAAATKYSEQQRQVVADTWDDGFKFGNAYGGGLLSVKKISEMKQNWLNNLFPSEIKQLK